jgi:drug/metabolite transporter (DMT)-like permease
VAQKPLLARVTPFQVTWLACSAGALVCIPFAGSLWHDASSARASAIAWTIYLGIVPTGIGFIAWAYALSRTTAGRMGSTTYLVTPIAILLGWLLLDETPPALALAGGALCLAGVAIARRARPVPR